ncbi:MAG: serine/threonine protein kinase [Hyphomonadaceae bacterium]|nr:serine/threonine protein kinase [Hyphomonadaceae bacterium]
MRLVKADAGSAAEALSFGLETLRSAGRLPVRVGAYRITGLLGVGGMGATCLAERDDGLFEHEVAIKILQPSLLPETALTLFERERRALAKLAHRNIAQLFDGGVTETGAPYIIMERVRGPAIDSWAAHKPAREVVAALIDVCAAVQFAHQNLVVHADLKPANVLMTEVGDPKVIDFGVARMLRDDDAGAAFPLTPGFASPARIAGEAPSPADDVFALGVMAGALLRDKATEAREDLDAIIERASAFDLNTRYPSVAALQEDLRRWLDFRPIAVRESEPAYAIRKFLRRRRLRVAFGVLALLGLVTALGITSLFYAQAERQRQLAERRFGEVRELAQYLLFDLYDRMERTPRSLTLRRDLARVAQGYLDQLANSPGAPDDVRRETAEGLLRIAEIQAGRHHANLGEYESAKRNLAEAERIAASLPDNADARVLRARIALRRASIAMNVDQDMAGAEAFIRSAARHRELAASGDLLALDLAVETASLRNWQGRYQEAREIARAVPTSSGDDRSREEVFLRGRLQDALAEAEYYLGDLDAAEAAYRRYADMTRAFADANPTDMEALRNAIRAQWALGTTLLARDRGRAGLAALEGAARRLPELLRHEPDDEASHRLYRVVLTARAQGLAMTGRFGEGVALLRAQVAEREALYRSAPGEAARARAYAISLAMLGDLHADNGLERASCPYYSRAEALFRTLERAGQLTPQDRGSALSMIIDRRSRHCS